jgi:hypothetical protein
MALPPYVEGKRGANAAHDLPATPDLPALTMPELAAAKTVRLTST